LLPTSRLSSRPGPPPSAAGESDRCDHNRGVRTRRAFQFPPESAQEGKPISQPARRVLQAPSGYDQGRPEGCSERGPSLLITMPIAKVIDLSHHNDVQFGLLKKNGVEAVILKATEGTSYIDPTFVDRVKRAKSVGLLVGAYHFMTGEDPVKQWAHFHEVVDPYRPLVLALDYETRAAGNSPTADVLDAMVGLSLKQIYRHPLLYGSDKLVKVLKPKNCPKQVTECPRWLARYGDRRPELPCDLWQFSESIKVGEQGPYDASDLINSRYGSVAAFWRRQEI